MEKNISFDAAIVRSILVKVAWPQLEMMKDEIDVIQVFAAGDEHTVTDLRIQEKEGKLLIEQPTYGLSMDIVNSKWMQIIVRVPLNWKGDIEAATISGHLSARRLSGRNISLDSVTGDLHAVSLSAIDMSVKTISGSIKANELSGDKLSLRSVSGDINVQGSHFKTIRSSSVSGKHRIELVETFDKLDVSTVSGDTELRIVDQNIEAVLRSISGRIRTRGVALTDAGPRICVTSVSADVAISCE